MSPHDSAGSSLPLVLMTGPLAPPAGLLGLRAALDRRGPVLVPELVPDPAHPADLTAPARGVLAAMSAFGVDAAVLCGLSYGAMVALQVAASHPGRVTGLVLCTGARPVGTAVRSLHTGAAGMLPARLMGAFGGGRHVLNSLDSVRPLDYAPLVGSVRSEALVLYGELDPANARASRQLARALPSGQALPVPGARPGWMWTEPDRLAEAAEPFVRAHGAH